MQELQVLLFVDGSREYYARMAATESTMLALGTPAPAFRLTDFNGKVCTLEDFAAARGLVVASRHRMEQAERAP